MNRHGDFFKYLVWSDQPSKTKGIQFITVEDPGNQHIYTLE